MYTIGQVSKMFGLPLSTLRYYDKEGLFPDMQRSSGLRNFGEKDNEAHRVNECLKKTGMENKEIKEVMGWCQQGASTYKQRREMFLQRKKIVESEILRMHRVLDMIRYKCWYYEQAILDGDEERLRQMSPEDMPEEIRIAYENGHRQQSGWLLNMAADGNPAGF